MKYSISLLFFFSFFYLVVSAQNPEIKWWYDLNDSSFGSTASADIDQDGKLELVFGCYRNDSMVYALNAESGTLLWKRNLSDQFEGCNDVAPLIFDVDQDGLNDVVVPSSCNPRTFCFEGATGETKWVTPLHGSDSPPTLADIDEDGKPEILHGNFGGTVTCLNGEDGSVNWEIVVDPNSWVQTAPTILDVENDGDLDFVVATWSFGTDYKIYCYQGHDQRLLWESDLPDDQIYHGASFADLDEDSLMELVIGSYDGNVYAINAENGQLAWKYSFSNPFYVGAPTSIADLNNDKKLEVVFFDGSHLGVLSNEGNLLWDFQIPGLGQPFRGAAISDVNDDKVLDVVFGSSNGVVYGLSGNSGEKILEVDLAAHMGRSDFDIDHGPVIADFDKDGFIDIFIIGGHTTFPDFENNFGRAYMITTNSPGGPDWLMFRNDKYRSGSVPLDFSSSVLDDQIATGILIYPNPSTDFIRIETEGVMDFIKEIEIISSQGTKLFSIPHEEISAYAENNELIIDQYLSSGIYFLCLKSERYQITQKFVIAR